MLERMSPEEIELLTSVIAILIAKDLSSDDITYIATIISAITSNLFLIAAQKNRIDNTSPGVSILPSSSGR